MKSSIELKPADSLTSAGYLADRVIAAYQVLDREKIGELESLYTEDVCLEVPSQAMQGITEVKNYFSGLMAEVSDCRFKFHSNINDGSDMFLTWTMFFNSQSLTGSETVRLEGSSYFKTRNGKIYYQRDYFDSAVLPRKRPRFIRKLFSKQG